MFKLVHVIGYFKYLTKIVHLSELSLQVLENILCNLSDIYCFELLDQICTDKREIYVQCVYICFNIYI